MPENAARKRRAREIARSRGIPYTAALRILDRRSPVSALRPLESGQAFAHFGRPVGIIAEPSLPGPFLVGTEGIGTRLREVTVDYGPTRLPIASVLTSRPLPGEERDTLALVTALHNFVAAHDRDPSDPGSEDQHHDRIVRALRAVEAASSEPATARFRDVVRPCVRVRVGAFEALDIPYEDGSIVYCGPLALADTVRFDLEGAS
ncbi:hypothetical protein AAW14_34995 [Streptomyces hygroscopicus]|uniref:hypothetical protein n=1 Tax=Streptomyces hygroscopicus TaxID=1912 RepID=UPI00223FB6BC|nr:hypothetical protein [Streptomyces hygroscopicus]MCW7947025.1 hypothetical protein [Streptomyces hygroscopicus]